jgi:hypothetical protein
MAKRTTQITVETEHTLIIRGANPVRAWCTRCGAEVDMVVVGATGLLARHDSTMVGSRGIARRPGEGWIGTNLPGFFAEIGGARASVSNRKPVARLQSWLPGLFHSWKDADPDLPILKQAKAEYAKLQQRR